MEVVSLRRYPVKSMGGEALQAVSLDARGIEGDRWWAVEDDAGYFASGKDTRRFRRHDEVFEYAAQTSETDVVTVVRGGNRWVVGDPALDAELTSVMGRAVRVTPESVVPHQDMGSVSIVGTATLAWCAKRWGVDTDPRRLRVNIVCSSDEPFIEESWEGKELTAGTTRFRVVQRVPRCRMIDLDQDGAVADGRWLKPLAAERDMFLAMYADVVAPGSIAVGGSLVVS